MKIQLTSGYHITATEKKAIAQMIEAGYNYAHNRPKTKMYTIEKGWQENGYWHYKVHIQTRGTFTIGRGTETQTETITIKTDKKFH